MHNLSLAFVHILHLPYMPMHRHRQDTFRKPRSLLWHGRELSLSLSLSLSSHVQTFQVWLGCFHFSFPVINIFWPNFNTFFLFLLPTFSGFLPFLILFLHWQPFRGWIYFVRVVLATTSKISICCGGAVRWPVSWLCVDLLCTRTVIVGHFFMPHSYDSPILLLFEGNFVPTEAVKIHIGNLADCRVHVCHRDNRRVISANFVWWTVWWNTVHMHQCLSVSRPLLSAVIKLNNRRLISIHSLGLLAMFAVSFFKGPFLPRVPISCFLSFFFFFLQSNCDWPNLRSGQRFFSVPLCVRLPWTAAYLIESQRLETIS